MVFLPILSVTGDKILSQQSNNKRNPDRVVSFPPLLRTIREQYSMEGREEEEYRMLGPSPLNDEIDSFLRRDRKRPRKQRHLDEEDEPPTDKPKGESSDIGVLRHVID